MVLRQITKARARLRLVYKQNLLLNFSDLHHLIGRFKFSVEASDPLPTLSFGPGSTPFSSTNFRPFHGSDFIPRLGVEESNLILELTPPFHGPI